MKRFLAMMVVCLLVVQCAFAEAPKEPIQVEGQCGAFLEINCPCVGCTNVLWTVIDEGVSLFPTKQLKDPCCAVALVPEPGVYRIQCTYVCKDGSLGQQMFEVTTLQPVAKKKKAFGPRQAPVAENPSLAPAVLSATVISAPPVQFAQPVMMAPPMPAPMAMPVMGGFGGFSGGSCSSCR